MRRMGAGARMLLEQAAAQRWNVDPDEVHAAGHRVHHNATGRALGFGELAEAAAALSLPADDGALDSRLKDRSAWKYIGAGLSIVDLHDMTTGNATYGADLTVPGMKIAVVARCPVYRGRVVNYDASEALKVDGVEQVVEIPPLGDQPAIFRPLGGVAVIGRNTWSVMQGREKLKIDWDRGPHTDHDSGTYNPMLMAQAREGGKILRDRGNVDDAFASAEQHLEADYFVPYYVHTPMEPPVALADATTRPVRIWAPVQAPNETRTYAAEAIGLTQADVECNVTLLGGAFGRKSKPDFVAEAAYLSNEIGAPVRVQWSREDEVRHGYYHAASAHNLQGSLDGSGRVTGWRHSGAWPTMMSLWQPDKTTGFRIEYGMGLVDVPYNAIPNIRVENGEAPAKIRIGWYRSVMNIQHAFAVNAFTHELATAAGRDPVDFMLELIGEPAELTFSDEGVEDFWNYGDSLDDWPILTGRLRNVLQKAREISGYGKTLPPRQGIGLACHRSFHSYVATAVHVAVNDDGSFTLPRVDTVIDCGRYVNPDRVRSQIEGAAVYGNTLARHGFITTTDGEVDQSNFHDYPISRMTDAPRDVRTHIVEDYVDHKPCGVGEPGVPPFAPALVNALYEATGVRIRTLPIDTAALRRT
jgi:isoquinoline 1-oxidoreductase beta subunit